MNNQRTLNNGCVCDEGCERCDSLARAVEAMREALCGFVEMPPRPDGVMPDELAKARAALALADKVGK